MTKIISFIFTLSLFACSTESNKETVTICSETDIPYFVLNDSCTINFNKIFNQITFNSIYYQFDSVYHLNPYLVNHFYSEDEFQDLTFLKFLNPESELNAVIADFDDDLSYHKMYFCRIHRDKIYIDESRYINCNVSFLQECEVGISYRTSQDSATFRINLRDSRMENTWLVDSCFGLKKFNKVLIEEKSLTFDDTLNIAYNQVGNDLQMVDSSIFNLQRFALSSKKLILEDLNGVKVPTYYYLSKTEITQ